MLWDYKGSRSRLQNAQAYSAEKAGVEGQTTVSGQSLIENRPG
jgi:hypothetical protein